MSGCYITTDANGVQTRNYVGDVTITITSASNGGTGYVPPACSAADPAHGVPEPGTLTLFAIAALALGARRAWRSPPAA